MALTAPIRTRIVQLKKKYDSLKLGKESLLQLLNEAEIPESVYNSNAIENSTLSLRETEKILQEQEVSRDVSVREVFEAKNLERVFVYLREHSEEKDEEKKLLQLHHILLQGIDDAVAGRYRKASEYVRIGSYIAPPPEQVATLVQTLLEDYRNNLETFAIDAIADFHLRFEMIHPFNDGNGRIGRVLINEQLHALGFPPIIIRDKEKKAYYEAFQHFHNKKEEKLMEKVIALALMESLSKRIAYLQGDTIITLAEYTKTIGKTAPAVANAAKRQNLPAFREKGVWKIAKNAPYLYLTNEVAT